VSAGLFPQTPRRHRVFGGLSERQEHIFTWVAVVVVLLYATAWVSSIHNLWLEQRQIAEEARKAGVKSPPPPAAAAPTERIATAVLDPAPANAFVTDAMLSFLQPLRGESGKLRFTTTTPGAPVARGAPEEAEAVFSDEEGTMASPTFAAPAEPGIYKLAVQIQEATRALDNFNVVTLVPFTEKHAGRIGMYYLGSWPFESGGTPKTAAYANPSGFIEVTRENQDTRISEHFRLRDFLTKDQRDVWPKYLLLKPRLLDKLELTIEELERQGHPVKRMTIMSGFRTPRYNVKGGNTAGRANLSRHMYGDASDVFVDNDGNGMMDDLNGDGRVDVRDAEVIQAAVEQVERRSSSLVGGVGIYPACCGHGPFTHIDVRGYRARWRGTGNG
jgi:uncharacterized protein YcbK (DUF882 family)